MKPSDEFDSSLVVGKVHVYEICAVDLTLCSTCLIYGEDFDNFCGLLRKYELYVVFREQDIRVTKKISREIIIRANNS